MALTTAAANKVWSTIERRAEKAEGAGSLAKLVELEDTTPILDHTSMAMFGRRGAGKTHTLLHLLKQVRQASDVGVYIDMRSISSNAGIYDDQNIEFGTRATNMLVDVISEVHEELYRLAVLGEGELLSEWLSSVYAVDFGSYVDRVNPQRTQVGERRNSRVPCAFILMISLSLGGKPLCEGAKKNQSSVQGHGRSRCHSSVSPLPHRHRWRSGSDDSKCAQIYDLRYGVPICRR